jgi:hypothetical protein
METKKKCRRLKSASGKLLNHALHVRVSDDDLNTLNNILMSSISHRYMTELLYDFIQDGINKFKNQEKL